MFPEATATARPLPFVPNRKVAPPGEISEYYHAEFCEDFKNLGFSYDLYSKTSDEKHIAFVQKFHKKLYSGGYTEERTVKQAYCPTCAKILTDRFVIGTCPVCGAKTRGDQCDSCNEVLDIEALLDTHCADCGSALIYKDSTQIFLLISKLKKELTDYLESHPYWRKNAIAFTKRYIDEGLRDRAITRDLEWGIDVPCDRYEEKKIYIWAENVLGYLSATATLCEERGIPFEEVFGENARHYYVHGKDNIPFHSIILPALLLGHGEDLRLPDDIISSEYITLEGRKISTSQNWAVWLKDLSRDYHPDAIRYFFIANGPEKRDTDFSWREFAEQNNSELVGAWGNFVNRTLAFLVKYRESRIPEGIVDTNIHSKVTETYKTVGTKIENGQFKEALESIFELVRFGNKYYDSQEPWKTRTTDSPKCADTLFNCTWLIGNLAVLLAPFLPFSSEKVLGWLGLTTDWTVQNFTSSQVPPDYSILFTRIEAKTE